MDTGRERTDRGWPRWLPRGTAADVLLAVFVAALVPFATVQGSEDEVFVLRPLDWFGYTLMVATALPLAVRRRWPVAAVWTTTGVTVAYILWGYWSGPILLPWGLMIYTIATQQRRVHAAAAGIVVTAVMVQSDLAAVTPGEGRPDFVSEVLTLLTWVAIAIIAGEVVRTRRVHLAQDERIREEAALRRVEEERLRIARELHDVLSHSISMISLQAAVAVRLFDRKPEQSRAAMVAVRQTSKDAMEELRAALGALREDEAAPRLPAPSLDRLDALVGSAAQAGVPVEVRVAGERRKLPAGVDAAAYRIVQEALTNVARHAGPATATVTLTYGTSTLGIQVDDTGRGVRDGEEAAGSGLIGLRERVTSVGGELDAGPRPGGGFRVRASLPAAAAEASAGEDGPAGGDGGDGRAGGVEGAPDGAPDDVPQERGMSRERPA